MLYANLMGVICKGYFLIINRSYKFPLFISNHIVIKFNNNCVHVFIGIKLFKTKMNPSLLKPNKKLLKKIKEFVTCLNSE